MHLLAFVVLACPLSQEPERHAEDTIVIPASVEAAWAAFTDPRAIERALGVADAKVELRPGGRIEWAAGEGSVERAPLWASRRILAHERGAMLAFSLVPPPSEPEWVSQRAGEQWSVLYVSPLAHDRTQVTVATVAQGQGPDFGLAIEHYSVAAREWVEAVALSFDSASAAGNSALAQAAVQEWCGGEWLGESQSSDGAPIRERVVLTPILGGTFVEETVWSGGAELAAASQVAYGAAGLPPIDAALVQAALVEQLDAIAEREWPHLARSPDRPSPAADEVSVLSQDVFSFGGRAYAPPGAADGMQSALATMNEARRQRIVVANQVLPAPLFALSVVTGAALILGALLVALRSGPRFALVAAGIVLVVGLDLAAILAISAPFDGPFAVSTAPILQLAEEIRSGGYAPWVVAP